MALRTISTYSRVRASGLSNLTPYQPSETCGPETPRPSRNRPPESEARGAAGIAGMGGGGRGGRGGRARRDREDGRADVDALGLGGDPGEHGGGVGPVRLGGPAD